MAFGEIPARPWSSADAERWGGAGRPEWASPWWPVVLSVVAVAAAVGHQPDRVCTTGAPCGAGWPHLAVWAFFVPHLLWLVALPEVAVGSSVLLLAWLAVPGQWAGGTIERVAAGCVVAGLVWGLASAVAELRARRRQRAYVRAASGGVTAISPPPESASPSPRRGLARAVLGLLLCGAAGILVATLVSEDRADDRRAAISVAAAAAGANGAVYARELPVVANEHGALTVRLPDGTRHRFPVRGDYRHVRTVRVLADGGWSRLAAEPYGHGRSQTRALALGLAGLGAAFLTWGLSVRLRVVRLRGRPVPVLKVLARSNDDDTEVFAHDDAAGLRPVLHFRPHTAVDAEDDDAAEEPDPALDVPPRPALLYGAVTVGGELVLARASEAGGPWLVEVTAGATARGSVLGVSEAEEEAERRHRRQAERRIQEALDTMRPAEGPVRWQASPVGRIAAVVGAVAVLSALGSRVADNWLGSIGLIGLGALILNRLVRMATWRVTADPAGLRVRGQLRTRFVRWADATAADYTPEAELVITCRKPAREVDLGRLGFPRLERALHLTPQARTAAAEITAMIRNPTLRPTG